MHTGRSEREVQHGSMLANSGAERNWGWGSPAGQCRAVRRARLIAEAAALSSGMKVLEIGCGTGNFTEHFAASGATVVAVDLSPDLLKIARSRGLPADRVTFLERRFEDCNIEGPFDAVIGSSVLHHLDLQEAIQRAFVLLKPGGTFCFAEPNMLNPQVFLERHFRFAFPQVSPDETAFVRFSLARQLKKNGFEDVSIRPFDWLHPATLPQLIGFVSACGRLIEKVPAVKEVSGSLLIRAVRPER